MATAMSWMSSWGTPVSELMGMTHFMLRQA
jgi:hypothetical protein